MKRCLPLAAALFAGAAAALLLLLTPGPEPPHNKVPKTVTPIPEPGTQAFRERAAQIAAEAEDLNGRTIPGGRPMLAIYERPADYPQGYVVRQYVVAANPPKVYRGEVIARVPTLDEARDHVPKGFFQLPRQQGEDPTLAEAWLAK